MSASNGAVAAEAGPASLPPPPRQVSPGKNWVHFDEEAGPGAESAPAVISAENVQVSLERSVGGAEANNVAVVEPKPLRNVELPIATVEPIRQGFSK